MLYEHKTEKLLPFGLFIRRLLAHAAVALVIIAGSLGLGILGYHHFEPLSWLDSLLNASMILGGMGPVGTLQTADGKIFASFYALFSGVVFLVVMGIILAPIGHRLLHRLHMEN